MIVEVRQDRMLSAVAGLVRVGPADRVAGAAGGNGTCCAVL